MDELDLDWKRTVDPWTGVWTVSRLVTRTHVLFWRWTWKTRHWLPFYEGGEIDSGQVFMKMTRLPLNVKERGC